MSLTTLSVLGLALASSMFANSASGGVSDVLRSCENKGLFVPQLAKPESSATLVAALKTYYPKLDDKLPDLEFDTIEALSRKLNQYEVGTGMPGGKPLAFWNAFPTTKSRAGNLAKTAGCHASFSREFAKYAKALQNETRKAAKQLGIKAEIFAAWDKVPLMAAGSETGPAAITQYPESGAPYICVNPEESPPAMIIRLMHEQIHATNKETPQRVLSYNRLVNSWSNLREQWESTERDLEQRWYDLFGATTSLDPRELIDEAAAQHPNSETLRDLILVWMRKKGLDETAASNAADRLDLIVSTAAFRMKSLDYIEKAVVTERRLLDRERFLGELQAYMADYFLKAALIATDDEFFCRLWIPSYRFRRPVRYFQNLREIHDHIEAGTFIPWLAEIYTFEMQSYLPTSLFVDGNRSAGLQKSIRDEAEFRLKTLLSQGTSHWSYAKPL